MQGIGSDVGHPVPACSRARNRRAARAGRHLFHRATGGGKPEAMHVSADTGRERDESSIRADRRLAGHEVPLRGEVLHGPAGGRHPVEIDRRTAILLRRDDATEPFLPGEDQGRAVGQPRGRSVIEPVIGEAGEPSLERDRVQVGPLIDPLVALALVRDEGDGRSIGTPGQVGGVDAERSQFPRGASGGREQVDLARRGGRRIAGIGEIAPPVEPVVHPFRGPAGEAFLKLALFGRQGRRWCAVGRGRPGEGDPPAVGTPERRFAEARDPECGLIQSVDPNEHDAAGHPGKQFAVRDSSGDQLALAVVSEIRRAGEDPSKGTSQSSERRRFSVSSV